MIAAEIEGKVLWRSLRESEVCHSEILVDSGSTERRE